MAPPGPQLVHKQFNSPMGLYSQQNIQDTLGKHIKHLDNGAVGIDWNSPGAEKPANLANSAVLKMLQEEEQQARQPQGKKKVVWPPTNGPDTNGYDDSLASQEQPLQQQQYKQPQYQQQQQQQQQTQQTYSPFRRPAGPAVSEGKRQEQCGLSKLIPVGPGVSPVSPARSPYSPHSPHSPRSTHSAPSTNSAPSPRGPGVRWAPVNAPASAHTVQTTFQSSTSPQQSFGSQQQFTSQQKSHTTTAQGYSEQVVESYQQSYSGARPLDRRPEWARSPPPATMPLRDTLPLNQPPPPVYSSQPAAQTFRGGVHTRGDAKWPPQQVREAVAAENDARRALAKGTACRPRKVSKDYSSFFKANALPEGYPVYRPPPGTQHYEERSGRSSY